ncbi:GNAT family N-acetyltransferase [Candidatus Endoriftia persephonae]|uniref:GNAT family N-acetyltransferase n=1 Tax=Candidatus Endoriftia persephonae TaxID=393765 RepID=A0A9J7A1F8_9GAMM|nr:GNAT family N-acetyltransferase [Candidatus Endoriftia persephone]USF88756.1 GNAT family N-acetyltransferase [Candidatus Endoriftia persephone]
MQRHLKKQGKVKGDLSIKADRCKIICIAKINEDIAGIGAIKIKTKSDFSNEKASVPELSNAFEWELGYLYVNPDYSGKGIATNVTRMLIDSYGNGNLMASTEISANPAMVKILEKFGFRLFGKPWKSGIHKNYLGLFLKFE